LPSRGTGEGARLVAEQLASSSASVSAAQLIATNGPWRRAAALVDAAGDQFLAGAALAGDQHGGVEADVARA
jgi:hypothetical protein